MIITRHSGPNGGWAKGKEIESGSICKLVSEANWVNGEYEGKPNKRLIAKAQFKGKPEALNISINNASIEALADAFGEDTQKWQGHHLTARVESTIIGGKRKYPIYLVPEGYELGIDKNDYVVIKPIGEEKEKPEEINVEEEPKQTEEF